jgi:hypothetical protein
MPARNENVKNQTIETPAGRRRDDLRYQLFAESYLAIGTETYLNAWVGPQGRNKESYAKHHSYKLVDQREFKIG